MINTLPNDAEASFSLCQYLALIVDKLNEVIDAVNGLEERLEALE